MSDAASDRPKFKPLCLGDGLELYRAKWANRHVEEPDDASGSPFSSTSFYWSSCPGEIPWAALKAVWRCEADDPGPVLDAKDGHRACPACNGPLATLTFDGALFNGAFFRACFACATGYTQHTCAMKIRAWVGQHAKPHGPESMAAVLQIEDDEDGAAVEFFGGPVDFVEVPWDGEHPIDREAAERAARDPQCAGATALGPKAIVAVPRATPPADEGDEK